MKIEISRQLADVLRDWAIEEAAEWPKITAYQYDLADFLRQLDADLPTADDVRGIMNAHSEEQS